MNPLEDAPNAEDLQELIEQAHGAVHEWRGRALEPFSLDRQMCFERIGVVGNGTYSSLEAAVVIVYLCTLGDEAGKRKIRGARGRDSADRLIAEAIEWGERQGIGMNNDAGRELNKLADTLWEETRVSRFTPVFKTVGSDSGN